MELVIGDSGGEGGAELGGVRRRCAPVSSAPPPQSAVPQTVAWLSTDTMKRSFSMYIVRNTFTAKPGMSSKLAKLMKEVMADLVTVKVRVMTDYIGSMNTVVMEMEVANLAEWEKQFKEYGSRADIQERMKPYADMYVSGVREVYQTV